LTISEANVDATDAAQAGELDGGQFEAEARGANRIDATPAGISQQCHPSRDRPRRRTSAIG
jgi:hypothetical protein